MREKYPSLALEILGRYQDGSFRRWSEKHLGQGEPYPWPPRVILPIRRAKTSSELIEIIGLPGAGKSAAVSRLKEYLSQQNIETKIFPELQYTDRLSGETHSVIDIPKTIPHRVYELVKLIGAIESFGASLQVHLEEARNRKPGNPILLINERGANDALVSLIRSGMMKLGNMSDNEFKKRSTEVYYWSLAHAEWVDAVILFGVSFQTAVRRREEMGKQSRGDWVNETSWPHLEKVYSWWLASIYPLLRRRHGTGLLVVDGEKPQDENLESIASYCQQIATFKNPGSKR